MSNNKKYQKLTPREHALQVPSTHIGRTTFEKNTEFIIDKNTQEVSKQEISYVPGAFKCVEEVLSNALDVYIRSKTNTNYDTLKNIKIQVDKENNIITCYNDGEPLHVYYDNEHEQYSPELVFSNLMAGESFTEERQTSGSVGEGASLTNTFSKWFYIEIFDNHSNQLYTQMFKNNNSEKEKPNITKKQRKTGYVKVSFKLDFDRFNMTGIDDTFETLIYQRAVQLSALTDKNVTIYYNNEAIQMKTFESYANLFTKNRENSKTLHTILDDDNCWEIIVSHSSEQNQPETISFVNGTYTADGGAHVEPLRSDFSKKFREIMEKKQGSKNLTIKPREIENNMLLFVKAYVKNPQFESNTKNKLVDIKNKKAIPKIPKEFVEKAYTKLDIKQRIIDSHKNAQTKSSSENDGTKSTRLIGIPDLEDANHAGKTQLGKDNKPLSTHCTLFLTEGLSAKQLVLSGMSVIGKNYNGVLPLGGKPPNVASTADISKSKEISNIKKALGLKSNTTYNDTSSLRYGRCVILADQDLDGSHIFGLLSNYFYYEHKSLLQMGGFFFRMITPILKATKIKGRKVEDVKYYYTDSEFKEAKNTLKGYNVEYLKGLASSTSDDAKEYFNNMNKNLIEITFDEQNNDDAQALDLALGKSSGKQATDERKTWLQQYNKDDVLKYEKNEVSMSEFIHKDFKHFSAYDIERSIPCFIDGLKLSQRKILYTALKIWSNSSEDYYKVSQFASRVSLQTNYAHGEASLQNAINRLCQDFTGSMTIPYLQARGLLGSRMENGADAGSPRYTKTKVEPHTWRIFKKDDNPILDYRVEEGDVIEPFSYYPVVPTVLINQSDGIGTGFSTTIPPFNPNDIITNLKMIINNDVQTIHDLPELYPWVRRFLGDIKKVDTNKFVMYGKYHYGKQKNWITVTEIPTDLSISGFKHVIEDLIQKKIVYQYNNNSKEDRIHFDIQFKDISSITDIVKTLHLSSNIQTSNMYLLDENLCIKKYSSPNEIIYDYYTKRLNKYYERKNYCEKQLKNEIKFLKAKAEFIVMIINNEIDIRNTPQKDIINALQQKNFPQSKDVSESSENSDTYKGFDYLLNMKLHSLTKEKKDELLKEKENREKALQEYQKMSVKDIWLQELEEFQNEWNTFEK